IIGGGMAGRRLAELLPSYDVTVLGDEGSYNRGRLTEYVASRAAEPVVGTEALSTVARVDRARRVVVDTAGRGLAYDRLGGATSGSGRCGCAAAGRSSVSCWSSPAE